MGSVPVKSFVAVALVFGLLISQVSVAAAPPVPEEVEAAKPTVCTRPQDARCTAQLILSDQATVPYVTYDEAGGTPIAKVAALLAHDLNALSGRQSVVAPNMKGASGTGIIIGRADSPLIVRLLRSNHIDTAPIR